MRAVISKLLLQLPSSSLTHLECWLGWRSSADIEALCSLTALRCLRFQSCTSNGIYTQADGVLAPLSALKQLTQLELSCALRSAQLQHLQLPQLQQLVMDSCEHSEEQLLQLGRLTALQQLVAPYRSNSCRARGRGRATHSSSSTDQQAPAAAQLPPNLRELVWERWFDCLGESAMPLLALSRLESLSCLEVCQ
jgi:hypothetical protein